MSLEHFAGARESHFPRHDDLFVRQDELVPSLVSLDWRADVFAVVLVSFDLRPEEFNWALVSFDLRPHEFAAALVSRTKPLVVFAGRPAS